MGSRAVKSIVLPLLGSVLLSAQSGAPPDAAPSAVVTGVRHPSARPEFDRGPSNPTRRLRYVTVLLKGSPQQQVELDRLLAAQRDPSSPEFQRWLTAAQFGERFGPDAAGFARLSEWLKSAGLHIEATAQSRNWIAFSGSVERIDAVFHTALHNYEVDGVRHFAPSMEPSVPADLAVSVAGFRGLDDFLPRHTRMPPRITPAVVIVGTNGNSINNLGPDDLAVIYNIGPLYGAGIDGSGQKLAIVGTSDVDLSDIRAYRSKFNLPARDPQKIAVPNNDTPPDTASIREASLDLEVAGAVARNSDLLYFYASNIEDAIAYAIDRNLASVLSSSFLRCENAASPSTALQLEAMAKQANVMGMTWVNASGDSGPAACDSHGMSGEIARHGVSVELYPAIPEVTGVGGTQFAEQSGTAYWNGSPGSNLETAIGYIPEVAWNESSQEVGLLASGGGVSRIFPRPDFQSKLGIDAGRNVPDLALTASGVHDPYLICYSGGCTGDRYQTDGGTSASAPAFAGILALLNQYLQSVGVQKGSGLSNINPMLYKIATTLPAAFHDITDGSNIVQCEVGTADCTDGHFGYKAGIGYDQVTGLGSVDVNSLFAGWLANLQTNAAATTTQMSPASGSISTGNTITLSVTVQAAAGAPGGSVTFTVGATPLGNSALTPAGSLSTTTFTVPSTQLAAGINRIAARYGGTSGFAPSTATSTITLTAPLEPTSVKMTVTPNPVYEQPASTGNGWSYTVVIREVNGSPATLTGFKRGAEDLSSQIATLFGSNTLPARGLLTAQLTSPPMTFPANITFELDGIDAATNTKWVEQFTASFVGRKGQAVMRLTAVPVAVLQNPKGAANCQWSQNFLLQEISGVGVTLNKLVAGGADLSDKLAAYVGSTGLPAGGALMGGVCWASLSPPVLLNYEVRGTDDNGNAVSAALTVPNLPAASSPTSLSVTPAKINIDTSPVLVQVAPSSPTQAWSVTVFSSVAPADRLSLSAVSGIGPAALVLTLSTTGLAANTYNATLVFQSLDSVPQTVQVPVAFTVK